MSARLAIHERVLHAKNREELMQAYGEWADHYEADLVEGEGYVAPVLSAELLRPYLPGKTARILDAGCGTGLVGVWLAEHGYTELTGLDYSAEMLDRAREKGVYGELLQADLNAPLDLRDAAVDAVICVGTLTLGHVGPGALRELARIVAPGGHVCFTVRDEAWAQDDYAGAIDALVAEGVWTPVERQTADYIRKEGSTCQLCLYRVAA